MARHRQKRSASLDLAVLLSGLAAFSVYLRIRGGTDIPSVITLIAESPLALLFTGIILFGVTMAVFVSAYSRYRLAKAGISEIDTMSGERFEKRLAVLFSNLGYSVKHTGGTNDFGADLIIRKDGQSTAVQAKRYRPDGERVHESAVQQAYSGAGYHRCGKTLVVTTGYFTPAARMLAGRVGVELWDRDLLIEALIRERDGFKRSRQGK